VWRDGASSPDGYPDLFAAILYTLVGLAPRSTSDFQQRVPLGKRWRGRAPCSAARRIDRPHPHCAAVGLDAGHRARDELIGYLVTTVGGAGMWTLGDSVSGPANPPFLTVHFIIKT
jgi:hypothetical protein